MKAVVALNNFWEWSGGYEQYLQWEGFENPDPYDFYTNDACQKHFRDFIITVLQRKNEINEMNYKDDDTIMAWQLANEP